MNRMCLAADVPLVESGTAGYFGQVTVIKKVRLIALLAFCHRLFEFRFSFLVLNRMLRMPTKDNAEDVSRLYNSQYSFGTHSLHCVGKTSIQVFHFLLYWHFIASLLEKEPN